MAEQNPAIFIQGQTHPAEDTRRLIGALTGDQAGIYLDADLQVQQNGTPNMSVNVLTGRCFIAGTEGTYQGSYLCENRGTTNKAIATADNVNPRWDLVIAKVQESYYSGGTNAWSLAVVTGVPNASPTDPAIPASSIKLARVVVAANATSIATGNITDLRARFDSWRKPVTATATSNLVTTSATPADIPGATITITTPRPNVTVVVHGSFDVINSDTISTSQGNLVVDGTTQAGSAYNGAGRAMMGMTWTPTLAAAGSHTLKLQGLRIQGAATITFVSVSNPGGTQISIANFY